MTEGFNPKETRTELIETALHEVFGEQCIDYMEGCLACDAWAAYDTLTAALDRIEALEAEIGCLKNPPDEYCAKCGSPKSNHPYRHMFVSMQKGDQT